MSDAATKTCSKCGEVKAVELFPKARCRCQRCFREKQKEWYEANSQRINAKRKEAYRADSTKFSIYNKKYWEANREKLVASSKVKSKAYREGLSDGYVAQRIAQRVGLRANLIPAQLIEVKRKHLQILRKLKEKPNEQQSKNP